jgi:hypothetical protein
VRANLIRSALLVGTVSIAVACAGPALRKQESFSGAIPFGVDPLPDSPDGRPLDGWAQELIELPPAFAPDLPPGLERLAFAPGMFEQGSQEFWSYAFVLELDVTAPDADQLQDWLEQYYDGLLVAVADERDIGNDPATVTVRRTGTRDFEATLHVIDTFVTFDVLTLQSRIRVTRASAGHCHLLVRVSPQPADHPVWDQLKSAADILQLQAETSHAQLAL